MLKYFLSNSGPVISSSMMTKCHTLTSREWLNFVETIQGSIVTCPSKRPCSIRLDQLDRDQIMDEESKNPNFKNKTYPLVIHFSMFRNSWVTMVKNSTKLKKVYHKYLKLKKYKNQSFFLED